MKNRSHEEVTSGLEAVFPRLWRYCLALTSNRTSADDLAQATCLRALEKSVQFEVGTNLDRWLFRIAQRTWLNELRATAVRRGGGMASVDEIEMVDQKPSPESNLLTREVLLEVLALPEAQRSMVMLVYVEGYSYAQAAEIAEIPIGTVMSRLAAARSKLSKKFEHQKNVMP